MGSGRKIDVDGDSYLEDGFVRVRDGKCWWTERFTSGDDIGLRVLSKGIFDFKEQEFAGSWETSSRHSGEYTTFQADLPNRSAGGDDSGAIAIATLVTEESPLQQQQEQQLQELHQDIIPIVMAKIELQNSFKLKGNEFSGSKNNRHDIRHMYYPNGTRCRHYSGGRGSEIIAYAMPVRQC